MKIKSFWNFLKSIEWKERFNDSVFLIGFALLDAGVFLIHVPTAFITAGLFLMLLAYFRAKAE